MWLLTSGRSGNGAGLTRALVPGLIVTTRAIRMNTVSTAPPNSVRAAALAQRAARCKLDTELIDIPALLLPSSA